MIFYFSGTGNSQWIAHQLADVQHEQLVSIADAMKMNREQLEYTLQENERIGFVFPVYSWAPPQLVLTFIRKLRITNYANHYLFFVCSCGDDIGLTQRVLCDALQKRGFICNAGFSVQMPNNYVLFPGFDVDTKEVETKKLSQAVPTLQHINELITERKTNVFECTKGSAAFLKTRIIWPLFNRFQVTAKPFFATDACISCALCEKACPVGNVKVEGKPRWGDNCTSCLACYHVCPLQAIQYGKSTRGKGQYVHK